MIGNLRDLNENQVRLRVALCLFLTWGTPGLLFFVLFRLASLPAGIGEHVHLGLLTYSYAPVFTVFSVWIVDRQVVRAFAGIRDLAPDVPMNSGQIASFLQVGVIGTFMLCVYLLLGVLVTALDASLVYGHGYILPDLIMASIAAVLIFVYTSLPNALYGIMLFGRVLGPRLRGKRVHPTIFRLLLAGPGAAGLTIATFIGYSALYGQQVSSPVLFLALTLTAYAVLLGWLAYEGYRVALAPLNEFLASDATEVDHQVLKPRSADETGAVIWALRRSLEDLDQYTRSVRIERERFQQFAEAASDFFFELDKDLKFSYFSERFETLTGFRAEAIVGLSAIDATMTVDLATRAAHVETLRNHLPYKDLVIRFDKANGDTVQFSVSGMPWFTEDGEFKGYRGAGRDITDLAHAQQALDEQSRALMQAQKMEAVGQLTGGVAHDFNNLLTVILGNMELVSHMDPPAELEPFLASALASAEKGATLVQRLLAFSRNQPLRPSVVRPMAILEDMKELLVRTLGENIRITLSADEADVGAECYVDAVQLENALLNLAINARDAMPAGGHLDFSVRRTEIATDGDVVAGKYVAVSVRDNGTGMDADIVRAAFEPFFTTKEVGKGSGLGLSMVYGLMKQSGGAALIDSVPGHGTTVTLLIPVSTGVAQRQEVVIETSGNVTSDGERLLVVEDDDSVRELLAIQLTGLGYKVVSAASGESATRILESGDPFDLVLTDIVLSGEIDGIDLCNSVSERFPETPVLLLSGYSDRLSELTGQHFMQKPYRLGELAEKLASLLNKH
ncbi:MAG: ATP-binding protein [Pseudomonadota bacterium]